MFFKVIKALKRTKKTKHLFKHKINKDKKCLQKNLSDLV